MIEIFTVGGGEYIVNVLNAVASWTGAGGYKSLIQVTMVMGLALAVIVLAFNLPGDGLRDALDPKADRS